LQSACLYMSVCPLTSQKPHVETSRNFLYMLLVASCGRGSVMLRRQCDVMYFRFMDDVVFSYDCCTEQSMAVNVNNALRMRGEVCYPRLPCWILRQSDCPSVRLSHACFVTNPKNLPAVFFIPHERAILLVFCHPTVVGGRRPIPPKMGDGSDPPSKIAHVDRFLPVMSQQ